MFTAPQCCITRISKTGDIHTLKRIGMKKCKHWRAERRQENEERETRLSPLSIGDWRDVIGIEKIKGKGR